MNLKDFFCKYKYIDITSANAWDDINEMVKQINHKVTRTQTIQRDYRYEYPLGNKNLMTLNYYKKYFITMKELSQIKGMASITIKDIYYQGEICRVAYLSDLKVSNDFCVTGKRQWRNAFLDLVINKDRVKELKECKFFYGLIDVENEQTKNLFSRFEKQIEIRNINRYSIHNIFSKKSSLNQKKNRYSILRTVEDDKDEVIKFTLDQIQSQKWCDSPKVNIKDINDFIDRKQSILIKDQNKIVGHICFMRTQIDKLEMADLSSKFKMANSILPLFSSQNESEDKSEKINSIYIPIFYISMKLNPLQRIEITKLLIQTVIDLNHREDDSIITLSNIYDRAIERALESFICMTKYMQVVSFKKKDILTTVENHGQDDIKIVV